MFGEPSPYIREEYSDAYRDLSLESYRFFKHSSRDANETHLFPPAINQGVMLDATEAYYELTNETRPHFRLFKWYMRAHVPALFIEPSQDWTLVLPLSKSQFYREFLHIAENPELMNLAMTKRGPWLEQLLSFPTFG